MSEREVQTILALCHAADIDCMVRPPTLGRTKLYRYLEDGAAGFLVPLISTPELARDLVQAAKFPPIGNRGIDGAGLDADFGIASWGPGMDFPRTPIARPSSCPRSRRSRPWTTPRPSPRSKASTVSLSGRATLPCA